jgi:hypothetical protein
VGEETLSNTSAFCFSHCAIFTSRVRGTSSRIVANFLS